LAERRGCLGLPWAFWLPTAYAAFSIYAWIDFANTNHDGLANLGLFLITLPVTVLVEVGGALAGRSLYPDGHGYLADHALYFVPAVAVLTVLLWLLGRAIDKRLD
jgi:hypothetical protein